MRYDCHTLPFKNMVYFLLKITSLNSEVFLCSCEVLTHYRLARVRCNGLNTNTVVHPTVFTYYSVKMMKEFLIEFISTAEFVQSNLN